MICTVVSTLKVVLVLCVHTAHSSEESKYTLNCRGPSGIMYGSEGVCSASGISV